MASSFVALKVIFMNANSTLPIIMNACDPSFYSQYSITGETLESTKSYGTLSAFCC